MGWFSSDIDTFDELFVHTLQDIYYAEHQIQKSLPDMIEKASDAELKKGLRMHLKQTGGQIKRLDRLTRDVRRKSGRAMTRAEIIRALIDGLIVSGIELTDYGSEAALRTHIAGRLANAGGNRKRAS